MPPNMATLLFSVFATLIGYMGVVLIFECLKNWHNELQRLSELGEPTDGVWQLVYGSTFDFLVFSAYAEDRELDYNDVETPCIRIVGVGKQLKGNMTEKAFCRLWYDDYPSSKINLVSAILKPIRENWNLNYTACFVYCPLPKGARFPSSVSIYSESIVKPYIESHDPRNLTDPGNKLLVHNRNKDERKATSKINMAACINPMHSNFSRVWALVEWLELNKLHGVSHFYFYNRSLASNVSCVFNHYIQKGEVSLLDWRTNLPRFLVRANVLIRDGNIFAAMNDCLYRGMYKHKYLMFADIDEFLVSEAKNTSLIAFMQDKVKEIPKAAYFVFKNTFFFLEWPNDPEYKGLKLDTQAKTKRLPYFDPPNARSKYVTRPDMVSEAGNHFVWEETKEEWVGANLNESLASSRHYRICEFPAAVCEGYENGTRDTRMWEFQDQLSRRMEQVQKEISAKCGLGEIGTIENII